MVLTLGEDITEKEYRAIDRPSYSGLSNIKRFGRDAVYGVGEDISDLEGVVIGSLVDEYITAGAFPANMIVIEKKPSNKPLRIIKAVLQRKNELPDINRFFGKANEGIIEEELNREGYYNTSALSSRIVRLKNYSKYANTLLKNPDAFIVSDYQQKVSERLCHELITRYNNILSDPGIHFQVKLLGTYEGYEVKGMLDFVILDHANKVAYPYDLKTGNKLHSEFYEKGYIEFNYYLQAGLYRHLLAQNLPDFKIAPFRFMYCGRKDFLPIVYEVSPEMDKESHEGFVHNGVFQPGIKELILDYYYYKERPNNFYKRRFEHDIVKLEDVRK